MEAFADLFAFLAGTPAMVGLFLAAAIIFLTSDWRLSLTGLLLQYLLVGVVVTRFLQLEVALVKILVGVLVVSILYLGSRQTQEVQERPQTGPSSAKFRRVHLTWGGGPLGLPLRLFVVLLVAVAVVRFFGEFQSLLPAPGPETVMFPSDVALVSFWLGLMGLVGLVLSGNPLRVAPALLTVMAAFDLIYAGFEPSLAIVGFLAALILLVALAFSYLTTVQGLGANVDSPEADSTSAGVPEESVQG
jgi:hypothetical protein